MKQAKQTQRKQQQPATRSASAVPPIDHPAFREFLSTLLEIVRECDRKRPRSPAEQLDLVAILEGHGWHCLPPPPPAKTRKAVA